MEDALILILQALLELIFELIINLPLYGWPFDGWGGSLWSRPPLSAGSLTSGHFDSPGWNSFWLSLVGCCLGGLSILFLKHTFIHSSALRIANLVYSPFLCGVVAYLVAQQRRLSNPRQRFFYAFWFTFGLALIRFTYGQH